MWRAHGFADRPAGGQEPPGIAACDDARGRARDVAALEAAQRGSGDVVAVVAVHRG